MAWAMTIYHSFGMNQYFKWVFILFYERDLEFEHVFWYIYEGV